MCSMGEESESSFTYIPEGVQGLFCGIWAFVCSGHPKGTCLLPRANPGPPAQHHPGITLVIR